MSAGRINDIFYTCLFTILSQSLHLPQMQERFQMHRWRGFNKSLYNKSESAWMGEKAGTWSLGRTEKSKKSE